ncbi:MAG: cyclic pyranopterin monophosphate synthase MoaC [Candidatus Adiutrix sp.]
MTSVLTHLDNKGAAHMVDVGHKPDTNRVATASASILMQEATLTVITEEAAKKGDVLATARLAGIMAAKKTSELIPLCHQVALSSVTVGFNPMVGQGRIDITATAKTCGPTGVEMEALTAVTIAALTIYDMAKAIDRSMVIDNIKLLEKTGGQSGHFLR